VPSGRSDLRTLCSVRMCCGASCALKLLLPCPLPKRKESIPPEQKDPLEALKAEASAAASKCLGQASESQSLAVAIAAAGYSNDLQSDLGQHAGDLRKSYSELIAAVRAGPCTHAQLVPGMGVLRRSSRSVACQVFPPCLRIMRPHVLSAPPPSPARQTMQRP
jgi:hypothetical protein